MFKIVGLIFYIVYMSSCKVSFHETQKCVCTNETFSSDCKLGLTVCRLLRSLVLQLCWHHLIFVRGARKRHANLWWSTTVGQRSAYLWRVSECWASSHSWLHLCCKSGWASAGILLLHFFSLVFLSHPLCVIFWLGICYWSQVIGHGFVSGDSMALS
jgi:hypothetical protein